MIPLLVVGDGPRDGAVLPAMLERIIGRPLRCEFRRWPRLNSSPKDPLPKGYDRKLVFALQQARDAGHVGLVAAVDADDDPRGREKLKRLRAGRDEDRRRKAPIPTAIGCAVPHSEAWLLDDHDAIRRALGIPATQAVPSSKYPKDTLDDLMKQWRGEVSLELLGSIAAAVDPDRQVGKDVTGYAAFVSDVREEFKAYRSSSS